MTIMLERLERTVGSTHDCICLWSAEGEIEVWNPAATSLTDCDPDAHCDAPTLRFLSNERVAGSRRVLLPIGTGRASVIIDLTVTETSTGGRLQVFHDATQSLAIEQARENFLVTIAHELRTPITTLTGFLDLLENPDLDIEKADLARKHSAEAGRRLEILADRIAHSSMLSQGRIAVEMEDVVLDRLVSAVVKRADSTQLVNVHGVRDVMARCDRAMTERILTEVVDNACKYGTAPITIDTASADDHWIEIVVCDAGKRP